MCGQLLSWKIYFPPKWLFFFFKITQSLLVQLSKAHSCALNENVAGGSVAVSWLFKQPAPYLKLQGLQCNPVPKRLYDILRQYQKGLCAFQTCKSSCLTKQQKTTPFRNGFLTILAFTQLNLFLYKQQAFHKELVLPREKRDMHLPFLTFKINME